jgi:hypothetical protein
MQQATSAHSGATPGTSSGKSENTSGRVLHFIQAISTFDRHELEAVVESLIGVLDMADGCPDQEDDDPAGDVLDKGESGGWAESLSDFQTYEDDEREDDDVENRAVYRDRARARACIPSMYGRQRTYRLGGAAAQVGALRP